MLKHKKTVHLCSPRSWYCSENVMIATMGMDNEDNTNYDVFVTGKSETVLRTVHERRMPLDQHIHRRRSKKGDGGCNMCQLPAVRQVLLRQTCIYQLENKYTMP